MMSNDDSNNNKDYVIIGDVHGMLEPLEHLLQKLGFRKQQGIYQHPEYIAIFAGDLVDRGKHQRGVLELVRAMVEYGSAKAIMGNHEYNVISFYSINPLTQQPFTKHDLHNIKQHEAILHDYPLDSEDTTEMIDWLKNLPLFYQNNDFRVIHATWDEAMIVQLENHINQQGQLHSTSWQAALTEGSTLHTTLRPLLKGVAIKLPNTIQPDARRRWYRICWWCHNISHWKYILCARRDLKKFADMPLPTQLPFNEQSHKEKSALFIGHYWFKGTPKPLRKNLACVDYSACTGGTLTAYVWHKADKPNQNGLRADRFVSVASHDYRQM